MPPPGFIHGPGKGGRRLDAERSFERRRRVNPLNTPSPSTSVFHGRINRKRPGDSVVDDNTSKRQKVSVDTPSPSPLGGNRGVSAGFGKNTPVIDLTDDAPEVNSSGSKGRIKSTLVTIPDTPPREARQAPRYSSPLFPSTPTPKANPKAEVVDLTLDSDDDSIAPSSTRPRKTAQSAATENPFGLVTPQTAVAPGRFVHHSRQPPELKYGQTRPANSAPEKGPVLLTPARTGTPPMLLTPARNRTHPMSRAAFQPGQITDGSPGASKGMTAAFKSALAQEDTKRVVPANRSMLVVRERKADQNQLQRGLDSVPRVSVRDGDSGTRKTDGETKNGDGKRAVDGRVDAGGANSIEAHADRDKAGTPSKAYFLEKQAALLRAYTQGTPARDKPQPSASFLSGRKVDAAVSARNRFDSVQQTVEKKPVGKGDGVTKPSHDDLHVSRSAPVGASQPQERSGLKIAGQAEKASKQVADGRADDGGERDGRGPTSLLEINRKEDQKDKQPPRLPRTPRTPRTKKTLIVTLKAPSHALRRISQRPVQRPDIPMGKCFLIQMTPEIQENIFRYLLLADDPIQVLHSWSKLYQRQRSGLHPAILSTCRTLFANASEFLYGKNVFRYLVRDRPQAGEFPSFGQDIYVQKYMPLFRKLELQIERSRTANAYCTTLANAIRLLNDHGANLHTLALDVSPTVEGDTLSTVGYFYRNGEIVQALKALKTCFITVRVFTPKTEDEPATSLCRKLDMRPDLGVFEMGPKQSPDLQLDNLSDVITLACQSPLKAVKQGLFEKFEEVPRQSERRARSSRIAY